MKGIRKIFIILCTMLFVYGFKAYGDSEIAPYSYKVEVGNKNYVFVMLTDDDKKITNTKGKEYKYSGLYENEETLEPLWKVSWYAFDFQLKFTDDCNYMVRFGPWARLDNYGDANMKQLAIEFYKNGQKIKRYNIEDYITENQVEKSASHFMWRKNFDFNKEDATVKIITLANKEYLIDIKSGEIIKVIDYKYISILLLLAVVLIVTSIVLAKKRKKH